LVENVELALRAQRTPCWREAALVVARSQQRGLAAQAKQSGGRLAPFGVRPVHLDANNRYIRNLRLRCR
jgi:hypothetical protein